MLAKNEDLTQKAMISRTTFYLHYKDKFDLLDQIENEILDGLMIIAEDLPFEAMANMDLLNEAMKKISLKVSPSRALRIPEHYAYAIIIGIHTSVINEWLRTGMKETPQELASMIAHIMRDVPKNAFE